MKAIRVAQQLLGLHGLSFLLLLIMQTYRNDHVSAHGGALKYFLKNVYKLYYLIGLYSNRNNQYQSLAVDFLMT